MSVAACKKAVSYLAENSGIIAALTQQQILTGDPDYALKRVKEAKYDSSMGHSPRWIRVRTTPPRRVSYQPMLPTGNQNYDVRNAQTGVTNTVVGDKTGRGCSLPAETIQYGYDVKNRCMMGKALEAGPWCIMDLLEKEAFKPLLETLWRDLPRYGKEDFGRQILRDVTQFAYYKFSVADGFPMSVNQSYFPTVPTGGPSIGFFRKVENLMRAQGWNKGAETPVVNGRVSIQIRMSREAIEWAISQRKKELGLRLESTVVQDDKTFGTTEVYEGIQFIEAEVPTRGFLRQVAAGSYEFVEIDSTLITTADGEGFWPIPNPEFYMSYVLDGGMRYRVIELAHIIHPNAMERQSMGEIPAVKGKTFNRNFDFTVNPIPDYELADRGCNRDMFYFGYRMLHAYAPLPRNPELMTAIAFLAPVNRYDIADPWSDLAQAALTPVALSALNQPKVNPCEPCTAGTDTGVEIQPVSPTCSDLFPANGVGVIRMRQVNYSVSEDGLAITILVDRVGGDTGASSVVATVTEGTATEPENFGIPSGAAGTTGVSTSFTKTLNWADGISGPVTLVVPIAAHAGDDDGKQFTVSIGTVTNSTLGALTTSTVTILDADHA